MKKPWRRCSSSGPSSKLKPEAKLEQLKEIANDLDSKITPLLNADQQKKFQEICERHRSELINK